MESSTINSFLANLTQKELRIRLICQLHSSQCIRSVLVRLSTTAKVNGTEGITTSNFTSNKEVMLADVAGTLSVSLRHVAEGIHGGLSSLIVTETVNVKRLDDHTRVTDQTLANRRIPFTETILN